MFPPGEFTNVECWIAALTDPIIQGLISFIHAVGNSVVQQFNSKPNCLSNLPIPKQFSALLKLKINISIIMLGSSTKITCKRHHDKYIQHSGMTMMRGGMFFTADDNGIMKPVYQCLKVECGKLCLIAIINVQCISLSTFTFNIKC